jgi:hypothetical protein
MSSHLKLMSDYHCFPLWGMLEGNVNPDDLPLSVELKAALHRWADSYDRTLNDDYPPDSGFANPQDEEAFEAEGFRLWHELQRELRGLYEVAYYSQQRSQLLPRSNDHDTPTTDIVPSATL